MMTLNKRESQKERSSVINSPTGRSINRLVFKDEVKKFFNVASVGKVPQEAEKFALEAEGNFSWPQAVEEVKADLGRLLSVQSTYITLYHNTTAGVQRIFSRLGHLTGKGAPTLLTSDIEYPGIMALADENWGGRLIVVQVADLIWSGNSHLVEEVLKRAVLVSRPAVFYGSHVARASGFVLTSDFLRFAREINPEIVIIIDGAQAVGNVVVDHELLGLADFYVTSGHKWLNGRQTLGIVHAHEKWKLDDPAQGYSAISGSRGTGSLGSLASLARSLEDLNGATTKESSDTRIRQVAEHNAALARYFSAQLRNLGLKTVGEGQLSAAHWLWSGIAVVLDIPSSIIRNLSADHEFEFSQLHDEPWRQASLGGASSGPRYILRIELALEKKALIGIETAFEKVRLEEQTSPVPYGGCARFCFHYYHRKSDVDRLLAGFSETPAKAKSIRRSRRKQGMPRC